MNRYFDKENAFDSNSRIFNAYYINSEKAKSSTSSPLSAACAKLADVRVSKLYKRIMRIAKPVAFSLALVGIVGVAGAIEAGTLGLGTGIAVSLALLGIEFLCLRRQRA